MLPIKPNFFKKNLNHEDHEVHEDFFNYFLLRDLRVLRG